MTASTEKPSSIALPEKPPTIRVSDIPSPGPEWSAEWPPFSSKHRQRISRPVMPDRKHSGMLDEEEDTRDIDLGNLSKQDLVRVLRNIRDDLAKIKLLGNAFTYRLPDSRIPVTLVEDDTYAPGTKYRIDLDTLEMKDGAAQAAYEESVGMMLDTDRKIKKSQKANMQRKLLQEAVYDDGYFNKINTKENVENGRFKVTAPSGYAYNPSYTILNDSFGPPQPLVKKKKFCYECGSKLASPDMDRCGNCVAKEAGLEQMERALRAMNIPSVTIRTPDEEEDMSLEADDGSDYASTTASTLSDGVGVPVLMSAGGGDNVEPVIVGSIPPEDFTVPVPVIEGKGGVAGKEAEEIVRTTF